MALSSLNALGNFPILGICGFPNGVYLYCFTLRLSYCIFDTFLLLRPWDMKLSSSCASLAPGVVIHRTPEYCSPQTPNYGIWMIQSGRRENQVPWLKNMCLYPRESSWHVASWLDNPSGWLLKGYRYWGQEGQVIGFVRRAYLPNCWWALRLVVTGTCLASGYALSGAAAWDCWVSGAKFIESLLTFIDHPRIGSRVTCPSWKNVHVACHCVEIPDGLFLGIVLLYLNELRGPGSLRMLNCHQFIDKQAGLQKIPRLHFINVLCAPIKEGWLRLVHRGASFSLRPSFCDLESRPSMSETTRVCMDPQHALSPDETEEIRWQLETNSAKVDSLSSDKNWTK